MLSKRDIYKLTEKSKFVYALYHMIHDLKVLWRRRLSDEEFAQKFYYQNTKGHLNLKNPETFDEKLWWLKYHYHNPLMIECVDKYKVREYVKGCGMEHILNDLYGVYDNADEIVWADLPQEFFLKTNHGCGCNFWCKDKNTFPIKKVSKKLNKNLKENYYYQSREWPYKDVRPRIIAEKVLKSERLVDYRFLCFSGRVEYLFVDIDTCNDEGGHKVEARRNIYTKDFELLLYKVTRENFPAELVQKPDNYDEMVRCAEKLARNFPFVRVDLYNIDGKIVFGELTFFHAGCSSIFNPREFSFELGKLIELQEYNP